MSGEIKLNLTYPEYVALDGARLSHLRKFKQSPAHYRHAETEPEEDTDSLRMGRCAHLLTFEPERAMKRIVLWDGGRRFGKEWDAFKRQHKGREILKQDELDECRAIAQAARMSSMTAPYVNGGQGELTLQWVDEETGIPCKARLDFVTSSGIIADLKTARDASPVVFGRSCASFDYHAQAAFYVDGYKACTGKELPFVVVAVEKSGDHVTQVYTIGEADLDAGRYAYGQWLTTLKKCRETGRWDGYAEGPIALSLPAWATLASEEDLSELGLQIDEKEVA